jgi:hypothetical protein
MAGCQTPNPQCSAYERGSQAFVYSGATTAQAQAGKAAPTNAKVYGLVPSVGREQQPYNVAVQVDVSAGAFDGTSRIELLGSLDGVNFYVIQQFTPTAGPTGITFSGGIAELTQAIARYLTVSVSVLGAGAPTYSISISL